MSQSNRFTGPALRRALRAIRRAFEGFESTLKTLPGQIQLTLGHVARHSPRLAGIAVREAQGWRAALSPDRVPLARTRRHQDARKPLRFAEHKRTPLYAFSVAPAGFLVALRTLVHAHPELLDLAIDEATFWDGLFSEAA